MMVIRDPATHRLKIAPPSDVPLDEWTNLGVFNPSIIATDMYNGKPAYEWLTSGQDADFPASELADSTWTPLPGYTWHARRVDNDSLGHTTAHRRCLPFFEAAYKLLPDYRIGGIYFECKTELIAFSDNPMRGIWKPEGNGHEARARFLLENGGINRAGCWLVKKERMKLKAANGGPG